jgi:hypothetical protein
VFESAANEVRVFVRERVVEYEHKMSNDAEFQKAALAKLDTAKFKSLGMKI